MLAACRSTVACRAACRWCPARRWATGGAATGPTARMSCVTSWRVPREAGAALGVHHRHGLAHHETGNASSGWTGYTWNRACSPILRLHRLAASAGSADRTEPASRGRRLAARGAVRGDGTFMGQDPASQEPVHFDLADPHFVEGVLQHPAPSVRGTRGGLLVARLAAGPTHGSFQAARGGGHGPAVVAQPPALLRPWPRRRQAPLHLLPLGRTGQPALPHRLLRR